MPYVLLVEDDPVQRQLAGLALRSAGHEVEEAPDGHTALTLARRHRPDVVVCDVNMPGMNGFEVLATLRSNPDTSALPVVMLTAMAARNFMRKGMTEGADDYLPKPYDPQELVASVAAVLARHTARHQATVAEVTKRFLDALDRQEQILISRYEDKLEKELSSRWKAKLQAEGRLSFQGASLLVADLFAFARTFGHESADAAKLATTLLQGARDSLYVFGASMVVPYGENLLAVFGTDMDTQTSPATARAVRAAFALQSAVSAGGGEAGMRIALAVGDIMLLRVNDPLHGDSGCTPVPCTALATAMDLLRFAHERGWPVAAMDDLIGALPADVARPAGRGRFTDASGASRQAAKLQRV